MKKLLAFTAILILTQCQIKIEPKTINANNIVKIGESKTGFGQNGNLNTVTYNSNGIVYRVFAIDGIHGKGIYVINETKEKLEIELLRKQIQSLK